MEKAKHPKGGDSKKRAAAEAKIADKIAKIDVLWAECAEIADKAGVSFYYGPPGDRDDGGGKYYPKRPEDWHNYEDEPDSEKDVNEDHPEYEYYHPWNDYASFGTEYDWSSGNWVSSSSRC